MEKKSVDLRNAGVCDDCIAVCAPGAVLSLPLFYERIVVHPYPTPATVSDIRIESDQLYDLLLQPETAPVSKLLFLAPTILFDLHNASESLLEHVIVESIADAANSWHYPKTPALLHDNKVQITVHDPNLKPAVPAFEPYEGQFGAATVSFPDSLQNVRCLGAMIGLKRTVFECTLNPPIEVGEKRWLRLCVKPARIFPNGNLASEVNPENDLAVEHSQLLDILGPDALLESLRDTLQNSLKSDDITITAEIKLAISELLTFTFTHGFEKAGTYTLIWDHRITLTGENLKIQPPTTEGSVRLAAIATISALGCLGYHWHGGLRFHWKHDPLIASRKIYEHARNFAPDAQSAKSKEDYTYATSVNHRMGCELIDILVTEPWSFFSSNDAGKTFYLNRQKPLPEDSKLRYGELVKIAAKAVENVRPAKAHFRIFFETQWKQLALTHQKRLARRRLKERLIFHITIISFFLAILAIIISLHPPQSSLNLENSRNKTNELDKAH